VRVQRPGAGRFGAQAHRWAWQGAGRAAARTRRVADHFARPLTDAQARAFVIADNKLTANSIWDDHLLAQQLRDLSLLDLDFSLEATGFEVGEIDLRIEGLTSQSSADDDPADAIPIAQAGPTISRAGDLWMLGAHRVYCGSALDQNAYTILMNGEKAALVFS